MRSSGVLLQVALTLLLLTKVATACVLVPRPTVLEAYEQADVVVIVRAVSQELSDKPLLFSNSRVVSTTMEIEKVFKGNLRAGDKITLGQGNSPGCTWDFYEEDIGKEYLFYLRSPTKGSKLWFELGFTRSNLLEYVADDLLYLNNVDARRGKTRVSGTIDDESDLEIAGRTIWLMGKDKVYETTTDKNGVYEFYDLPPGRYVLEPELPFGWKIDSETVGTTTIKDRKRQIRSKHVFFTLEPRRHAAINLSFVLDNVVNGSVVDSAGKPLSEVEVSLEPTDPTKQTANFATTDEKGYFTIQSIEGGTYVLVVNRDSEKRIEEPFAAVYYPNAADEAGARVFRIRPGDNIKGLRIVVPNVEETVTLAGVVRLADGRLAPKSTVRFMMPKVPGRDGYSMVDTDSNGRFSLKVFKGVQGELHADFFAYSGDFERLIGRYDYAKCPEVQNIVKQTGSEQIKTPALTIDPKEDLRNLVLIFPFSTCPHQPRAQR
jgi:hypothetical protein